MSSSVDGSKLNFSIRLGVEDRAEAIPSAARLVAGGQQLAVGVSSDAGCHGDDLRADRRLQRAVRHADSQQAERHRSDSKVLGSGDQSVRKRRIDPSATRYLIQNAPCLVLVDPLTGDRKRLTPRPLDVVR